jgi:2-hydroxy-3-keto-5-methylthiopentenyl-1-phosphate phosphatase
MPTSTIGPKEYADALYSITQRKEIDHQQVADFVSRIPPSTLSQMLDIRPELTQFLEAETALDQQWSHIPKDQYFFGESIEAIDHHEKCSVLSQYLGAYFMKEWNESKDQAYLDKACKLKLFPALVARCEINVTKIKNNADENNAATKQLFSDIETLSHLYWFPGSVHGALLLTNLADYFEKKNDDQASMSQVYYEAALEMFLTAKEYAEISENNKTAVANKFTRLIYEGINLDEIYKGENLKTITGDRFENWGQAQNFFLSHLSLSKSRLNELAEHAYQRTHPVTVRCYLDFDGTLTGLDGVETLKSRLYTALQKPSMASLSEVEFIEEKPMLETLKKAFQDPNNKASQLSAGAAEFLKKMHEIDAEIFIISNNRKEYIKAVLELAGMKKEDIAKIIIKDVKDLKQARSKQGVVQACEKLAGYKADVVIVGDDSKLEFGLMSKALSNSGYASNSVIAEHASPGQFHWEDLAKEVLNKASPSARSPANRI